MGELVFFRNPQKKSPDTTSQPVATPVAESDLSELNKLKLSPVPQRKNSIASLVTRRPIGRLANGSDAQLAAEPAASTIAPPEVSIARGTNGEAAIHVTIPGVQQDLILPVAPAAAATTKVEVNRKPTLFGAGVKFRLVASTPENGDLHKFDLYFDPTGRPSHAKVDLYSGQPTVFGYVVPLSGRGRE